MLTAFGSNGKIDKRSLKAAALAPPTPIIKEKTPETTSSASSSTEKVATVDAAFYATDVYGNDTPKTVSTPSIPPPVYQSDASISEKKLAYEQLPALEKQTNSWDGYKDDEIPDKTQGKIMRNLRHQVFSLYRRLFGVVFVTNVAILIASLVRPGGADAQYLGLIVVANLFCAILMRQDYVINAFFTVACAVPISYVLLGLHSHMFGKAYCLTAGRYSFAGHVLVSTTSVAVSSLLAVAEVLTDLLLIVHSGCAISGLVWLIVFTVQATKELLEKGKV